MGRCVSLLRDIMTTWTRRPTFWAVCVSVQSRPIPPNVSLRGVADYVRKPALNQAGGRGFRRYPRDGAIPLCNKLGATVSLPFSSSHAVNGQDKAVPFHLAPRPLGGSSFLPLSLWTGKWANLRRPRPLGRDKRTGRLSDQNGPRPPPAASRPAAPSLLSSPPPIHHEPFLPCLLVIAAAEVITIFSCHRLLRIVAVGR